MKGLSKIELGPEMLRVRTGNVKLCFIVVLVMCQYFLVVGPNFSPVSFTVYRCFLKSMSGVICCTALAFFLVEETVNLSIAPN